MPTITGTGNNGDTVTLFDGSTRSAAGTVAGGAWSITATMALTEGANAITATQIDVAGNVSAASSALNVTLDTRSQSAPGSLTLTPGTAQPQRRITNVAMPTFTGNGDAGATVTLIDGSTSVGTGTVDGLGLVDRCYRRRPRL